jgi:hypothetical protein
MENKDIGAVSTLNEFFHEAVSTAMRNQGVESTEHAEFYLVNLLAGFAKAPIDDQPLALQLAEATLATPEERARHLRIVGDRSLYVSGFFEGSLSRRLVDVDYCIRLGGTAYRQLADLPAARREPGVPSVDVFRELAAKFARFVDVLAEVSEWGAVSSDAGVLALYERWVRTGSAWIERRLRARGVLFDGRRDVQ